MGYLEPIEAELIYLGVVLFILLVIRFISHSLIGKLGRKSGINPARIKLIKRYTSIFLIFLAILTGAIIFGADFKQMGIVFSSVFAVVGIGLFAVWSILSNVTSGIIMFFSFPYKVGDKIQIHDKDFPIEAIIEDIRGFHLYLRTDSGNLITYPNNMILQKAVTLIEKDAIDDYMQNKNEDYLV